LLPFRVVGSDGMAHPRQNRLISSSIDNCFAFQT
jgi:hypothetical protein